MRRLRRPIRELPHLAEYAEMMYMMKYRALRL